MDVVFYIEIGGGGAVVRGTNNIPSFGEREHAVSFARSIQAKGYRPRFVVGPYIAQHIRLAGFEPEVFLTPELGVEIVRRIDPALVVACELFNLSPESAAGLIGTGVPIATMDGTTVPLEINSDPFRTPELSRSLVLPDRYYSFRPCPVHDLGSDTASAFYWSVFPKVSRLSKHEGLYAELGLDPSRRTVMFAAAPWAQGAAIMLGLDRYYVSLVNRIVDALVAAGEPIDFVFISLLPLPSDMPAGSRGAVAVHYSGLLPYDRYDYLLRSCDAIVSDNVIQTSVSKAVVMGTPHLVIQNLEPSELPYPCNMFPLKVLFPCEREYARLVEVAEYDDVAGIRDKLGTVVTVGHHDEERRHRRSEYVDRLGALAAPGEIIARIVGPANPDRSG